MRGQFTLIIFLLVYVPNVGMTLLSPSGLRGISLLWLLLVALLSAVFGFILSGSLLRPLSRLANEVKQNDFSDPHRDDPSEIRALRGAFTGLLHRLQTEQNRRGAFMATLVHDLKTPLIATGHLTQVLTTLPLPEAERREIGRQIQAETSRLLALVHQMADAHRYELDDVRLHLAPTDLRELLDDIARRLASKAGHLKLQVHGHGHARADAKALERAVTNLAENALRYATERVDLLVTPQGVTVANDGPALDLPLNELAQPFNSQPATIAGQQYTAGTAGLGLFIVRRIAEVHGGELIYRRACLPGPANDHLANDSPNTLTTAPDLVCQDGVSTDSTLLTLFTITLPEVTP
nr:HAMP domain-containing sensor histidine kinase [Deinococcus sp.]